MAVLANGLRCRRRGTLRRVDACAVREVGLDAQGSSSKPPALLACLEGPRGHFEANGSVCEHRKCLELLLNTGQEVFRLRRDLPARLVDDVHFRERELSDTCRHRGQGSDDVIELVR